MVVVVCASLSSSSSAAFLRSSRPTPSPLPAFLCSFRNPDSTHHRDGRLKSLKTYVQNPTSDVSINQLESQVPTTGGAYDFKGATISVTDQILSSPKTVTLVRHGLSSWNDENRVQGSSNLSILTEVGARQAEKCRSALTNISFDICFSSPISRAKSTAELIWHGREEPLIFLDSLKEAHLFFLEGMTNGSGC